jgi:hypothetical protein
VDALHPKRQSVLGNTVNQLFESVLAAAHPKDPNGALFGAMSRRDSTKSTVGAAIAGAAEAVRIGVEAGCQEEGGAGGGGGAKVLSRAYINAKKARDECAAKQHLSMLVSLQGMTEARVMELCSERTPLVPGMTVIVIQAGNHEVTGVFESLSAAPAAPVPATTQAPPVSAAATTVAVVPPLLLRSPVWVLSTLLESTFMRTCGPHGTPFVRRSSTLGVNHQAQGLKQPPTTTAEGQRW